MTKATEKIKDVSSESSLQCNFLLVSMQQKRFQHRALNTAIVYQPVVVCKVAQDIEKSLFHHARAVKKHLVFPYVSMTLLLIILTRIEEIFMHSGKLDHLLKCPPLI